jgi:hypothetical protein
MKKKGGVYLACTERHHDGIIISIIIKSRMISIIEYHFTDDLSKDTQLEVKTLFRYLNVLVQWVEEKIRTNLHDRFKLVFDFWTGGRKISNLFLRCGQDIWNLPLLKLD